MQNYRADDRLTDIGHKSMTESNDRAGQVST